MFLPDEFWWSLVFFVFGGIIALLSLKLWEAEEREKRRRQGYAVTGFRKFPREHDERSTRKGESFLYTHKAATRPFSNSFKFFSAKDGNYLISPAFFTAELRHTCLFRVFCVHVVVITVLLLAAHLDTAYYSDCE